MLVDVWDGGDSARDGGGRGGKRRWLTLNDEPALKPTAQMFVGSKAPWDEIPDDLPQHDAYPWGT